jgi:hypothetical protein
MWLTGEIGVRAIVAMIMVVCGLAAVIAIAAEARRTIPAAAFGAAAALLGLGFLQLSHELTPAVAEGATMLSGVAIGMALGAYLCWWFMRRKPKPEREPTPKRFSE